MTPTSKHLAADPDAAAVQEPRQRGHLGLGAGPLPAAAGRGGRRVRPDRDGGHAAARRGRPRPRRPLGRQGPRQGRRAAGQLRARHGHHRAVHGAGRGLLGPPHRSRDPRVRPGRRRRAPDLGARGQGDLEGRQAAGSPDPHDRPVAGQDLGQVRPDRRHVDLPDEGREDRGRPGLDRLRRRPRLRRRDDVGPRPAAAVQAAPARARRSSRAASASAGAPRRCRAAATGRCPS